MLGLLPSYRSPYAIAADRLNPNSERAVLDRERDAAYKDVRAFARHARIQDDEGVEIAFGTAGWPWQFVLLALWAMTKLSVVLKARQLGVSWLAAMYALWVAIRRPGQSVLLISHRQADADKLLAKVAYIYERLPAWKPRALVATTSIRFPDIGSEIESMPATANIGRSRTVSLVVLDEHGHQPFARQILLAVAGATEAGQIVSLSTANGLGALHSQLFIASKGDQPLAPMQLPDGTPLPLRVTRDVGPNGWRGIFVPFSAHPEHDAAWWASKRIELEQLSDAEFIQEHPRDDIEAIQVTGRPVFRPEDIARATKAIEIGAHGESGLTIYRQPQPGHIYLIGADVAEGLEQSDWSSATVLDRDSGEQVAQLRGRWTPDIYAARLDRLARMFAAKRGAGDRTPVILAVERNNHGHAALLRLGQLITPDAGYTLYRAKDRRLGWVTDRKTRPVLVDQLEAALRTEFLVLHDAGTVEQFSTFHWNDDGKPEAQEGYHDDDVIAAGIAIQIRRTAFGRILDAPKRPEAKAA